MFRKFKFWGTEWEVIAIMILTLMVIAALFGTASKQFKYESEFDKWIVQRHDILPQDIHTSVSRGFCIPQVPQGNEGGISHFDCYLPTSIDIPTKNIGDFVEFNWGHSYPSFSLDYAVETQIGCYEGNIHVILHFLRRRTGMSYSLDVSTLTAEEFQNLLSWSERAQVQNWQPPDIPDSICS